MRKSMMMMKSIQNSWHTIQTMVYLKLISKLERTNFLHKTNIIERYLHFKYNLAKQKCFRREHF